jgi:hypothetical protein
MQGVSPKVLHHLNIFLTLLKIAKELMHS